MSNEYPVTMSEWESHVQGLSGRELMNQAIGANTMRFVRTLGEEGYKMTEIDAIVELFARRLSEDGQIPPTGGIYNMRKLAAIKMREP